MTTDATRVEKVEVVCEFPVVHAVLAHDGKSALMTLREKDARDLMHAFSRALHYQCSPK